MSQLSAKLRQIAQDQISEQDELTILEAARRIELLENRAAELSWQGCVDRQGGSFDQDELDAREQW